QTYADTLGMRVLRIVSINEGGSSGPQPMPVMRMMAAPAPMAKDTAVAAGESSVSVSVDMVFELGR
ncbi:MAG TPA: SIMPL domain-containing protein, partial [Thermomonas sp.]|nr:SIMPL domain-containing protein [Thermomonas sp.]